MKQFAYCPECGAKLTYNENYCGNDDLKCFNCGVNWSAEELLDMIIVIKE